MCNFLHSVRRLVAAGLAAVVAGCGGGDRGGGDGRPKVLTTFTILADMVRNVGGDRVVVESITKPGAEIHGYEPTPQDIMRAQSADLVLANGLNLEVWFERFLEDLGDVPRAVLTEGIEPIGIEEGAYEGKPNPHAWMSPANAVIYVENIRRALEGIDPGNAEYYEANAAAYAERIRAVDGPVRQRLAAIPERQRWLVTSEGAFPYLCRNYGLRPLYLWPVNADQQGTPQQVKRVIDAVREHRIPAVFSESTVSDRPAREVAAATGARYGGVLYVDSLTGPEGPVPTFLDLLQYNAETIMKAFQPEP